MQPAIPPQPENLEAVRAAINEARLQRYLPASGGDTAVAFSFYLWNLSIAQAFAIPLHFAEVTCRNSMAVALARRFTEGPWYRHSRFLSILDNHNKNRLNEAIEKETVRHGRNLSDGHIVSALTFGFWENLATRRFERIIWAKGVKSVFSNSHKDMTVEDLNKMITSVRTFRNRISHHEAIFDKKPTKKHQDCLNLISLSCRATHDWVASCSRVPLAVSLRPLPK